MTKIKFNRIFDKIAIIAPSSGCENSWEKLLAAEEILNSKGFIVKYDKNILSTHSKLKYFASSRKQRVYEFQDAILDPEVKIIWAFRGGYGASEIVFDFLDILPNSDKILIGFSDITVLHLLFHQKFKIPSIHGSVLTSIVGKQSSMLDQIISVLSGADIKFDLKPLNDIVYSDIKTIIFGGNLAMVCHMIGSDLTPETSGKIIFLEDINEKGYHVHRYLMQMRNAGLFIGVAAVIFGDFALSDDNFEASLRHFCAEYLTIPAFKTKGIGHLSNNFPITIGAKAQIKNNLLTITSPFELI